jgi:hypothetical protein
LGIALSFFEFPFLALSLFNNLCSEHGMLHKKISKNLKERGETFDSDSMCQKGFLLASDENRTKGDEVEI